MRCKVTSPLILWTIIFKCLWYVGGVMARVVRRCNDLISPLILEKWPSYCAPVSSEPLVIDDDLSLVTTLPPPTTSSSRPRPLPPLLHWHPSLIVSTFFFFFFTQPHTKKKYNHLALNLLPSFFLIVNLMPPPGVVHYNRCRFFQDETRFKLILGTS